MIKSGPRGDTGDVMSGAQPALASMFFASAAEGAEDPSLTRVDSRRFRQIAGANLDFVWRCLRRMGIPNGDVDDAVQQVFLVVASKLDSIAQGSERAFLFATASDEAHHQMMQADTVHDPSQEELTDQLRARALMDHVLAEMPDDLREVFVLFELEELSVAEVADLLAIPIGTVGSRLRRAREDFHDRVRRIKATMRHKGAK